MQRSLALRLVLSLALAAIPKTAEAQQEPTPMTIRAVNLTAQSDGRAVDPASGVPASRPGDVIEYQLSFTNPTDGVLRDVVFDDPIPSGLMYVLNSASAEGAGVSVAFSTDGGANYSPNPQVEVEQGGQTVLRPAPAELYTHVRWIVQRPVAVGEEVRATFRARIKGGLARNLE
jgi:uncharacterized repeat protein (TIGR01451 family)